MAAPVSSNSSRSVDAFGQQRAFQGHRVGNLKVLHQDAESVGGERVRVGCGEAFHRPKRALELFHGGHFEAALQDRESMIGRVGHKSSLKVAPNRAMPARMSASVALPKLIRISWFGLRRVGSSA